jgi:GcrA cell cycle regulator
MAWTDERVELLKKLWAEGLSASQIANQLGSVTRNAVIGKVHRLGLSGRATTSRVKSSRARRRPSQPRGEGQANYVTYGNVALKPIYEADADPELNPQPKAVVEIFVPVEERASILTLSETKCRWPIGDPTDDDFYFCGRTSPLESPYCDHHKQVAYQPPQSRRRKRSASQ